MHLIGVPFDLGGKSAGARLGPGAFRLAGLDEAFGSVGLSVTDCGNVQIEDPHARTVPGGLHNFEPMHQVYRETKRKVGEVMEMGETPLVVGGDHSLSIGSIGAAIERFGDDLAVLWVDAHADLNTPATSPSGNLHGMALACMLGQPSGVTGLQDIQWNELIKEFAPSPISSERIAWLGLRDVDEGERDLIQTLPHEYTSTMTSIDRYGLVSELNRFDRWMKASGVRHLWVSFDVDVLDPFLAPGTGTAVRGGLTYREMHLMAEMLHEFLHDDNYELVGLDIVETNPLHDERNTTAKAALEWVVSILGKTILGFKP